MADRTITTYLKLEGESEYKAQLKSISQEMSLLKSELAASESAFRDQANSMEALESKGEILQKQYEAQAQKIETLSAALEQAKAAQTNAADTVEEYRSKLEAAEREMERLQNSTEDTTEEEAALAAEIERLKQGLSDAEVVQQKATNTVNRYQKELNYAEVGLNALDDEIAKNAQYMEEARTSADGCATSIDQFGKATGQAADNVDNLASLIAADRFSAGLNAIETASKKAAEGLINLANESQEARAIIAKATGATGDELDALRDSIWNVLQEVGSIDVSDAAAAIGEINTRLGSTGRLLEEQTVLFARFATVTNQDVTGAVESVTRLLRSWGVETSDLSSVLDRLTVAGQKSGIAVNSLTESLVNNYAYFQQLGFTLDESIALLSQFELNGVNASTAIQGLKKAVSTLTSDGKNAAAGLQEYIDKIKNAGSETEATSIAIEVFGTRAGAQLATAIRTGQFELTEFVNALENSGGAMERTAADAETMEDRWNRAVNGMKAGLSGFSDELYEIGLSIMPIVQSALGFIGEHAGEVATGIAAMTAATIAYTTTTKLATVAMTAFNTALTAEQIAEKATGIGLIVSAVAAGIAVLSSIVISLVNYKTETQKAAEAVRDLKKAQDEAYAAADSELSHNAAMISTLQTLVATQGETAAGKEKILALVSELNSAVPDLALAYDAESNSLNMTAEAMMKLAEAEAERQRQQADLDTMTEAMMNQQEAAEALAQAELELAEFEAMHGEELEGNTNRLSGIGKEYAELKDRVEDLSGAYDESAGFVEELQSKMEDATGASEKFWKAVDEGTASVESMESELDRLSAEYEANRKAAEDSFTKQISLFDDWSSKGKADIEDLIHNLESQAEYWNNYSNNVAAAIDKISNKTFEGKEEMIATLTSGTEEGVQLAAALANGTDAQIDRLVAAWKSAGNEAKTAADVTVKAQSGIPAKIAALRGQIAAASRANAAAMNQSSAAASAGAQTAAGYSRGILSGLGGVAAAARSLAQRAVATIRASLAIASPSKVFMTIGEQTVEGFIEGIESQEDSVKNALSRTKSIVDDVFKDNDVMQKRANALMDSFEDYFGQVANTATAAAKTLESALDEISDKWDDVDNQRQKMLETLREYGSLTGGNTKTILDILNGEVKQMSVAGDNDLFQSLSATRSTGWLELIQSAKSQTKFYEQYGNLIRSAQQYGLNEELIKKYADGSEKGAQMLASIVAGGQKIVDQINDLYEKSEEGRQELISILSPYNKGEQASVLSDIESQTEVLIAYSNRLEQLKGRGVNSALLAEVTEMDIEEAIQFSQALLDLTDEEFARYMESYQQKQNVAAEIADKWYRDELTSIENEYQETLKSGMASLQQYTFDYGKSTVNGIIAGMRSSEAALQAEASKLANIVKNAVNSGQTWFIGSDTSGLELPYLAQLPAQKPTNYEQTAAVVNALNTVAASIPPTQSGDMQVTFVVNGAEMARATLQDFRNAAKQNPTVEGAFV